jgi:hypothetical protein
MEVLVSTNEMDEMDYVRERDHASRNNLSSNYSFVNSELNFDNMKVDSKNIFIDGNNFNLDVLKTMIKNLKPYKITHLRIEGRIFYKTIFQSDTKAILVDGSLTSGYAGGGPSDFGKLLKYIEVDEEIIEKYIFKKQGEACLETTFILADNV